MRWPCPTSKLFNRIAMNFLFFYFLFSLIYRQSDKRRETNFGDSIPVRHMGETENAGVPQNQCFTQITRVCGIRKIEKI